ncbi:MAG: hypothetical protein F6K26_08870 [Moorea sp. SIO2I5]|nr:hypothetical protein [Moorena sp. SIO2I5]
MTEPQTSLRLGNFYGIDRKSPYGIDRMSRYAITNYAITNYAIANNGWVYRIFMGLT